MDIDKAKKILRKYKAVLAKGTVNGTSLHKLSSLPYGTAKIKYAIYALLESGKFDEPELINDYADLASFVEDTLVDKYVKNYETWQAKKADLFRTKSDESLIKQYLAFSSIIQSKSDELRNEVSEFVRDMNSRPTSGKTG